MRRASGSSILGERSSITSTTRKRRAGTERCRRPAQEYSTPTHSAHLDPSLRRARVVSCHGEPPTTPPHRRAHGRGRLVRTPPARVRRGCGGRARTPASLVCSSVVVNSSLTSRLRLPRLPSDPMEAVYFDTSALRALGMAVLRRFPPGATYQTSVLALMELASGLRRDRREYQRRRALLCGLAEMRFPIISRGPEQMLRAAFRVLAPLPEDNRLLSVGRLTALVREASELAEFETSIRTRGLVPLVESFEIYDRTVGEHYVQHSVDGH